MTEKNKKKRAYDCIKSILEARSHFENAITIVKTYFELESNGYIQKANKEFKCYSGLISYLGVANARLDILNESLRELERGMQMESRNQVSVAFIEQYRQVLLHYMESFIIVPLKMAIQKFNSIKTITVKDEETKEEIEKEVVKDMDFFSYLLFLEVYRVSEVEGAIARQIIMSGGRASGLKTIEQTNVTAPPSLPSNLRTEEPDLAEEELYSV